MCRPEHTSYVASRAPIGAMGWASSSATRAAKQANRAIMLDLLLFENKTEENKAEWTRHSLRKKSLNEKQKFCAIPVARVEYSSGDISADRYIPVSTCKTIPPPNSHEHSIEQDHPAEQTCPTLALGDAPSRKGISRYENTEALLEKKKIRRPEELYWS